MISIQLATITKTSSKASDENIPRTNILIPVDAKVSGTELWCILNPVGMLQTAKIIMGAIKALWIHSFSKKTRLIELRPNKIIIGPIKQWIKHRHENITPMMSLLIICMGPRSMTLLNDTIYHFNLF